MECEAWMYVLMASSREKMKASMLCLQGGFPVDHPKDSSHFSFLRHVCFL